MGLRARVLGGLGVQDVIRPRGAGPERAGTTLRAWDAARGIWRAVFMSPGDGEFVARSFLWQARTSADGGASWRVTHEISATRRA